MKFALTGQTKEGVVRWLAWSDGALTGSEEMVERAHRMVHIKRQYGKMVSALDKPHVAMNTLVGVLREFGQVEGPIDFAGITDEGEHMPYLPAPEPDLYRR